MILKRRPGASLPFSSRPIQPVNRLWHMKHKSVLSFLGSFSKLIAMGDIPSSQGLLRNSLHVFAASFLHLACVFQDFLRFRPSWSHEDQFNISLKLMILSPLLSRFHFPGRETSCCSARKKIFRSTWPSCHGLWLIPTVLLMAWKIDHCLITVWFVMSWWKKHRGDLHVEVTKLFVQYVKNDDQILTLWFFWFFVLLTSHSISLSSRNLVSASMCCFWARKAIFGTRVSAICEHFQSELRHSCDKPCKASCKAGWTPQPSKDYLSWTFGFKYWWCLVLTNILLCFACNWLRLIDWSNLLGAYPKLT